MEGTTDDDSIHAAWQALTIDDDLRRPSPRPDVALWVVAALASVLDVVLTAHGMEQGFTEGNPIVRNLVAVHGFESFVLLKAGALALAASVWWVLPRDHASAIPAGFAIPTLGAVAVNAAIIAG